MESFSTAESQTASTLLDDGRLTKTVPNVLDNLSRDTIVQVAGSIVCSVAMLAMNYSVVRLIGRDNYGGLGVLQSFAQWCATMFAFGGAMTVTILSGENRHRSKSGVLGVAAMYIATVLALTTCAVAIERQFGLMKISDQLVWTAALGVICYAGLLVFFESFNGLLRGADQFDRSNLLGIGQALTLTLGSIAGAWMFSGSQGAFWGGNILAIGFVFVVASWAVKTWGLSWEGIARATKVGFGPGLRTYVVASTEIVAETFGVIYLARIDDLAGAAAIIGCQRLCTIVSKPAAMVSQVIAGKTAGQKCGPAEAITTLRIARTTFLIALAICAPLLLMVGPFTQLSLGEEFRDAAPIMVCFLIGAVCRGHASAAVGIILGQGCPLSYLVLKIVVMVVTIAGTLLLSGPWHWGAFGVAVMYLTNSVLLMAGIGWMVARQAWSRPAVDTEQTAEVMSQAA